jgi:hypothetical protein
MSDDTLQRIKELLDGAAPETVTLPKSELEALRAAAAPGAGAETPGQEYVRRQKAAAQAAPSGPTRDDLKAMSAQQIAALPQEAVDAALAEGGRSR